MADSLTRSRFSDWLTSRSGAWIALGAAVLAIVVLFGVFGGAKAPVRTGQAPVGSESTQVSDLLEQFPNADRQSVLVVASRKDGAELSDVDIKALSGLLPVLDAQGAGESSGPMVSGDGKASVLVTPITIGSDNTETAEVIKELRSEVSVNTPTGLVLQVTGGPAFGADVAAAFEGADFTLLLVTILIVAVLLIVTYR
ncbi:MAG TPA: MMPL family transporter, partial [Arachnia sp.]|nr:MMPL family transporter [Arachnia sp.]